MQPIHPRGVFWIVTRPTENKTNLQSLGHAVACKDELHLQIVPCCCQKASPVILTMSAPILIPWSAMSKKSSEEQYSWVSQLWYSWLYYSLLSSLFFQIITSPSKKHVLNLASLSNLQAHHRVMESQKLNDASFYTS